VPPHASRAIELGRLAAGHASPGAAAASTKLGRNSRQATSSSVRRPSSESPTTASSRVGPRYRSRAPRAVPKAVGARSTRARAARSAETPALSRSASPVSRASRWSTSAAIELPAGTALSNSSLGRASGVPASAADWKNPPRSSANSRTRSRPNSREASIQRGSKVFSQRARQAAAMAA